MADPEVKSAMGTSDAQMYSEKTITIPLELRMASIRLWILALYVRRLPASKNPS